MVAPIIKQTWVVSAVLVNMLVQGMVLSFPSCLLPALRLPQASITADLYTQGWLASCNAPASAVGFFASGYLMHRIGRKKAHAVVILPGCVGWLLIYFACDVTTLMLGRILGGFTAGGSVTLGAIVIGEYSSPKHRGMFLNLKTAAVSLGGMIVHGIGNYTDYKIVSISALVPQVISFAIIFTWPESPAWLASRKQFDLSEKSFIWLRGTSEKASRELTELIKSQKEQMVMSRRLNNIEVVKQFFNKFRRKDFLKPLIIIFFSSILLEACGRHIFPAFALDIIGDVTGDKSSSFYYIIGIDVITTFSSAFSSVLIRIMKRRTLLFSSSLSALIVLFSTCLYLFLMSKGVIPKDKVWIPLTMLITYFILANFGCTPIPLALLGEMFPLAHREAGMAMSGIIMALALMGALQLTPPTLKSIHVYGLFTVLGATMVMSLLVLYLMMPETKDRTLQEIEFFFNHGYYRDDEKKDEEVKMKMVDKENVGQ